MSSLIIGGGRPPSEILGGGPLVPPVPTPLYWYTQVSVLVLYICVGICQSCMCRIIPVVSYQFVKCKCKLYLCFGVYTRTVLNLLLQGQCKMVCTETASASLAKVSANSCSYQCGHIQYKTSNDGFVLHNVGKQQLVIRLIV